MPRFDDGMVNIQELIRIMAKSFVNEIMDAQAENACAGGNQCNGYRPVMVVSEMVANGVSMRKVGRVARMIGSVPNIGVGA